MSVVNLVAHVGAASAGNVSVTTGSIDTTGAILLVAAVTTQTTTPGAVSDSKGNVWNRILQTQTGGTRLTVHIAYTPVVGSGHTFTCAEGFTAIEVQAFNASGFGLGFAGVTFAVSAGATTLAPGSLSLPTNSPVALFVDVLGLGNANTSSTSIGSSFSLTDSNNFLTGQHFGGALAWKESTTAENPSWSWTTTAQAVAQQLVFNITNNGNNGGGAFGFAG